MIWWKVTVTTSNDFRKLVKTANSFIHISSSQEGLIKLYYEVYITRLMLKILKTN